jgi:hypothetical protein
MLIVVVCCCCRLLSACAVLVDLIPCSSCTHPPPPLPTPPPAVSGVQHHSVCVRDQGGCHRWHLFGFPQLRHRCDGEDGDSKSSRCPRHGVLEYALGDRCSLRVGSLCRCDLYSTSRKFSDARGYHTGVRWWCLCLCRASCIVSLLGFSSCWSKVEFFRSHCDYRCL